MGRTTDYRLLFPTVLLLYFQGGGSEPVGSRLSRIFSPSPLRHGPPTPLLSFPLSPQEQPIRNRNLFTSFKFLAGRRHNLRPSQFSNSAFNFGKVQIPKIHPLFQIKFNRIFSDLSSSLLPRSDSWTFGFVGIYAGQDEREGVYLAGAFRQGHSGSRK